MAQVNKFGFGKDTAREIKDYPLFTGVAGFRIVTDVNGKPVINPTREVLSKYMEHVDADGDPYTYIGETEFKKGTFIDNDGSIIEPNEHTPFKVRNATLSFLLKSIEQHEFTVKVKGVAKNTKEFLYKVVSFKFADIKNYSSKKSTYEFYNDTGMTTWMADIDGVPSISSFKKEHNAKFSYRPVGAYSMENFINFIYSYAQQRTGQVPIMQWVNFDEIFKGNISSVKEIFELALKDLSASHGIKLLYMVENSANTGSTNRQAVFPKFQQLCDDTDGTITDYIGDIKNNFNKLKKPKDGEVTYTPAGRGWFVGKQDNFEYKLLQFNEKDMKDFKDDFDRKFSTNRTRPGGASNAPAAMPNTNAMGGGGMAMPPLPSGVPLF